MPSEVAEETSASADIVGTGTPRAMPWWHPWLVLAMLAATHFLVDIVAGTTNPLWPSLESRYALHAGGLLWVYVLWSVTNSFGQLFFGILSDRAPCRWLIWCGPAIAIVCVSSLGFATSSWALAILLVAGGLGIAAFHPEAAATAGSLLPRHRSRAMAIFALCGYLGQSVGPYYSGAVVETLGFHGLLWGVAWALPALGILALGIGRSFQDTEAPVTVKHRDAAGRLSPALIVLLLSVGTFRILPALGVPLALAYLLEQQASRTVIGAVQSAFMGGIGIGAMLCAVVLHAHWERRALWLFPLLAAPILACLGVTSSWTLVALVGTCGLLLGITMPVYISYGQQLLPHSQRIASSMTMGVSWGVASGLVGIAMWVFQTYWNSLDGIFLFFAVSSAISGLLSHLLPHRES